MNKNIILCILGFIIIFAIVGCSNNNQSNNNQKDPIDDIKSVADQLGYKIEDNSYLTDNDKNLIININDTQYLDLTYESNHSNRIFGLTYYKYDNSNFDTDFFLNIVNIISEKRLTKEELMEFLNSKPEKYPPEKYGYTKQSDEKTKKVKSTFWQNWELIYSELEDGSSSLFFGSNT